MPNRESIPFALRLRAALLLLVLAVAVAALPALADEFEREFTFDADELAINNLVGAVQVTGASGDEFVVEVNVRGDDAEVGLLEFISDDGRESSLAIQYPTDEHRKYVYPPMGRHSNTTISYHADEDHGGSWLKKIFGGMTGRIKVSGRGSGLEIWSDLVVRVPEGAALKMKLGVGEIEARNVEGDLVLDSSSGKVTVEAVRGDVLVDTGSGSVRCDDVVGSLLVDTGSGRVEVAGIRGDLDIDTGSGSVDARAVEADEARIDTGSGSVELELDRMGDGKFIIDTGSGSVELVLPNDASAHIEADTGSGGVRNKVNGADIIVKERDYLKMIVGDGDARVSIDTGSGSVTIRDQ